MARPRTLPNGSRRFTLLVPPALWNCIVEKARQCGQSVSEYVRTVLAKACDD